MHNDRRMIRTTRGMTAACGVIAFLGIYTIAFAKETVCTTSITDSNNQFGRLQ